MISLDEYDNEFILVKREMGQPEWQAKVAITVGEQIQESHLIPDILPIRAIREIRS